MKTTSKILLAGLPVIAMATGSFAAVGTAAPAPAPSTAVVTNGTAPQSTFVWTAAAMQAAKPMEIVAKGTAKPGPAPAVKATGPRGLIASQAAPGDAAPEAQAVPAAAPQPMSGGFTYPTPFTRYQVESQLRKQPGTRAVGKLFFTQNGGSYVCSASTISDNEIWTAGHCVSDGAGNWSSNMLFIPSYRNGTGPYGSFSCFNQTTSSAWHFSGDLRYDYAGADCGTNSLGQNFASTTGWLGFAWNWGYGFHYDDFGYPAAAPFNGQLLQRCESSFGHVDARMSGLQPQAIGCDMTGGSSGGPWIWQFGTGNYVNGENSYKYTTPSEPLEMYSPYYGDVTKAVYDAVVA